MKTTLKHSTQIERCFRSLPVNYRNVSPLHRSLNLTFADEIAALIQTSLMSSVSGGSAFLTGASVCPCKAVGWSLADTLRTRGSSSLFYWNNSALNRNDPHFHPSAYFLPNVLLIRAAQVFISCSHYFGK